MVVQMQMERQLCNVNDVVPRRQDWKVLIQVLERKNSGISWSIANPTSYRGYFFVDTVGILVSVVCYVIDVAYFETSLMPYKRYYISDAYVKPTRPGYKVGDYDFSWTLYNATIVQPVDENVPPTSPYDFHFKKFSDLFRYADCEDPINIKALIVEPSPEKKVGQDLYGREFVAQDFIVVDTEYVRCSLSDKHNYATVVKYYSSVLFLKENSHGDEAMEGKN